MAVHAAGDSAAETGSRGGSRQGALRQVASVARSNDAKSRIDGEASLGFRFTQSGLRLLFCVQP
jgi:hypothetical protein